MDQFKSHPYYQVVLPFYKSDQTGHGIDHLHRVIRLSLEIAATIPDVEMEKVLVIAFFHESLDYKFACEASEKSVEAELIKRFDFKTTKDILKELKNISYKGGFSTPLKMIEAKIVQDADRLDSIGAIGIARAFYYAGIFQERLYSPGERGRIFQDEQEYCQAIQEVSNTTLNHFFEKLLKVSQMLHTHHAKQLAKKREQLLASFVESFIEEWGDV